MSFGRPRPCQVCGLKPRAHGNTRRCYDCMPGGPYDPPPCKRCGTTTDFYASRLCRRCHHHAPQQVDSCRDCLAWGAVRRERWLCRGCSAWRRANPEVGSCRSCQRVLALDDYGVCRLCWRQAALVSESHSHRAVTGANRQHWQQLFLADMFNRTGHPAAVPEPVIGQTPPVPSRSRHRQDVLFPACRDLSGGYRDLPDPPDPQLAAALDACALEHSRRLGWSHGTTRKVRYGLRLLLRIQDSPGAPLTVSEAAILTQVRLPVRTVCEVLADADMLIDDRTPAIDAWFARAITGLPEQMTNELRTWFEVMRHGSTTSPRRRPRHDVTTRLYVGWICPALRTWAAAGHLSLREITGDDVRAVLPASGTARSALGRGLGSLFAILKARKLVFLDPTARIRTSTVETIQPLPANVGQLRAAMTCTDVTRAAMVALVAFHGLRTGQLTAAHLTDVRDGRLHLDDRSILLAEPVRTRLASYLDHRTARWPSTANPHLFLNCRNATRTTPVGGRWVWLTIDLLGGAQAIRKDRILHEAHDSAGDARKLCDMFGISITTATRYTDTVDHPDLVGDLPGGPPQPAFSSRTQAST